MSKKNDRAVTSSKSADIAVTAEPVLPLLVLPNGSRVTGFKTVTRPMIRQIDNEAIYVKIESEFVQGEELKRVRRDGSPMMQAIHLAQVINLETGEEAQVVGNTILLSSLDMHYPNGAYVGKSFAIMSRMGLTRDGRKVREYAIKELVIEE